MNNCGDNVLTAIIGVAGTLLGTILGWFLNVLSNKGKLSVFLESWSDSLKGRSRIGSIDVVTLLDDAIYFEYRCTIEIYNGSSKTKIIRAAQLLFCSGKTILMKVVPRDISKSIYNGPAVFYKDIGAYNIPANQIITIPLTGSLMKKEQGLDWLSKVDRILFEYIDERNHKRTVLLKKLDNNNTFDFMEEQNGQDEDAE